MFTRRIHPLLRNYRFFVNGFLKELSMILSLDILARFVLFFNVGSYVIIKGTVNIIIFTNIQTKI